MSTPLPLADTYFVCATPRTGSSLLLGLLDSTGVAGHPQAYFRGPDEPKWAARWQLPRTPDDDYAGYLRAVLAAGRSVNGVFGAKLMWGTHAELVSKLSAVHPDLSGNPKELLRRVFGAIRFIHLRRADVLAQAVSWLRAEQSGAWYVGGNGEISGTGSPSGPATLDATFDAGRIGQLIQMIEQHNDGWEQWFAHHDIEPYRVRYEELAADLGGVTQGILAHLGIDPAGRTVTAHHQRQADRLNDDWVTRYRATTGRRNFHLQNDVSANRPRKPPDARRSAWNERQRGRPASLRTRFARRHGRHQVRGR